MRRLFFLEVVPLPRCAVFGGDWRGVIHHRRDRKKSPLGMHLKDCKINDLAGQKMASGRNHHRTGFFGGD